jgi:hypothetical protein
MDADAMAVLNIKKKVTVSAIAFCVDNVSYASYGMIRGLTWRPVTTINR